MMALVWVHVASPSTHAFPRAHLATISPSSHATIVHSLLFNSSSRMRRSLCSSSTTATPEGGEVLHTQPTSDNHHRLKKQAQRTTGETRSGPADVLI
jgi:hypothetical protein